MTFVYIKSEIHCILLHFESTMRMYDKTEQNRTKQKKTQKTKTIQQMIIQNSPTQSFHIHSFFLNLTKNDTITFQVLSNQKINSSFQLFNFSPFHH